MPTIPVETPAAKYDVTIGRDLLRTLFPKLRKLAAPKPLKAFIISSPELWAIWRERVLASFPKDQQPQVLLLPAGESYKRMAQVERLAQELSLAGADRDSLLVAFGGGVVGDLTGFLAAIYMRGIGYVGVPTTLLAQVDSSLGGKTGVNLVAGKNLIGAFHHPMTVLTDIDTLTTLPASELRAGLQEAVKAAIIYDPKLFRYLEANAEAVLAGNAAALTRVVTASVKVKADVVGADEKESGLRMILNFGHTIGHAIEAATQYRKLLHGEAVGWGMIAALYVSLGRQRITQSEFDRMRALILQYGPLPPFRVPAEKLVALTGADKKRRSGTRSFVLTTGIGKTEIVKDVTDEELLKATNSMLGDVAAVGRKKAGSTAD